MASFPFRDTALAFDRDAFAKFTQQPDRAGSLQVAANTLSTDGSRPTAYDESALRKVMGGSRISHDRAKNKRNAADRRREQTQRIQQNAFDDSGLQANNSQQKNIEVYAQSLAQQHRVALNNTAPTQAMTQGSPMNPGLDGQEIMFGGNQPRPGIPPPQPGQPQQGSHAFQDYQMQMMLLEQQNRKRILMARQEQDNMSESRQQVVQPPPPITGFPRNREQQDNSVGGQKIGNEDMQQPQEPLKKTDRFQGICQNYTISEDDTISERERQKAKFIALQNSSGQPFAMPRDWGN